jgi:ComF family protein
VNQTLAKLTACLRDGLGGLALAGGPSGRKVAAVSNWSADCPDDYCHRCGATLGPGQSADAGCDVCRDRPVPWDRIWRLGEYAEPLSAWLIAMKFQRQWRWASFFGDELANAIQRQSPPEPGDRRSEPGADASAPQQAVVHVPLHWTRRMRRGYDQSQLIADRLACRGDLPLARILQRTRRTAPQSLARSNRQRADNVRKAFKVTDVDLTEWRIWLVDDVKTSGATAAACARLLRRAGAQRIDLVVVAVAGLHNQRQPRV